ncbi:putative eka-like protein [Erysiphe necator]|uniref:Putative eka-like protein n=1 Tax=Uncinula necator TaxID=52586 RepID=A0A0B1P4G6_UNCNE|nr:putative eka-like protein [Erysiphe necator]
MTESMEFSQESQAPSTESSQKPPPIPPIPPIPNPIPPIASSSFPSSPNTFNTTLDSRQILKHFAPAKRTLPEKPQDKSMNNSDIGNAFLPQELAEIIATRQRRERAWHARLMICTTVISYLDSTLVNFTNEIEKEEVVAFKAYLRQAIANFAATDSSPSPPQVPTHTRPNKGNGKGNVKTDKNITKKIAVATPQITLSRAVNRGSNKEVEIPNVPQIKDKTWAIVARKGMKKARVVSCNNTQASTGNKNASRVFDKDNSSKPVSDKGLFVRLPQEHEWRKLSPAGIREVVVKKLAISPTLIGRIKPVNSGFALSPCSTEARDKILNAGNGIFLSGVVRSKFGSSHQLGISLDTNSPSAYT